MIERTPLLNGLTQLALALAFVLMLLPIYMVFVASTHDFVTVNRLPMPLWPGASLIENYSAVLGDNGLGRGMANSLIMAVGVTVGKVLLAALSAYAIVYFRFRLRKLLFWMIFATLMLPLEVRIVPSYAVAANALSPLQELVSALGFSLVLPEWNLLNSYAGLVLPLVATATGTFLYRQFFLTVPDELAEAARMDGAGPLRFLFEILLPLSRNNMAALATIMFVYAWNQYLWPLLITTDPAMATAAMQLNRFVPSPTAPEPPIWNLAMAATVLVMLPPLLVVLALQRWFVRGLVATEK